VGKYFLQKSEFKSHHKPTPKSTITMAANSIPGKNIMDMPHPKCHP
jgi:hypothetical protein